MLGNIKLSKQENSGDSLLPKKEEYFDCFHSNYLGNKRNTFVISKNYELKRFADEKSKIKSLREKSKIFETDKQTIKTKGPFVTKNKNQDLNQKFDICNSSSNNFIFLGKENSSSKNNHHSEEKEETINSSSNLSQKFNFLNKELYDEDFNSKRIQNIYSHLKKNFKRLPKTEINTKDLMNTYRILENINKLNGAKSKSSFKKDRQIEDSLNLNENETSYKDDFFYNYYNENDYEEKLQYECVFGGCGKGFETSEKWKAHYELHSPKLGF